MKVWPWIDEYARQWPVQDMIKQYLQSRGYNDRKKANAREQKIERGSDDEEEGNDSEDVDFSPRAILEGTLEDDQDDLNEADEPDVTPEMKSKHTSVHISSSPLCGSPPPKSSVLPQNVPAHKKLPIPNRVPRVSSPAADIVEVPQMEQESNMGPSWRLTLTNSRRHSCSLTAVTWS
ncbi:hypothetical protein K439DRAFT_254390 [Ramaria rubella]|nr:hypothetical protein K439DRAFT_254390 [Ramaria rubella]